jgi:tetratricopeptide (TPR) repeat protein
LQEFTYERVPVYWAETQTRLGVTLATLGAREGDAARLEEAVATLRAALQVYTREREQQQWARTQAILSGVLTALGSSQNRTAPIEQAIAAYKDVLPVLEQAGAGDTIKEQLTIAETTLERTRGRANFYAANYDAAVSDFLRAVRRKPDEPYGVLWLYLARTRAGNPNAPAELQTNAAPLKRPDWPYPVVELFLARRTPDALLAAAGKPGEICEAQFYIGEWRLLQGNRTSAAKALKTAADNCPKGFEELAAAQAELQRLSQSGRGSAPTSRRTQIR